MIDLGRARKVYFHTFGCRANQYDSERMRQLLERRGCETVDAPSRADAVVVNSCTVTRNADSELRRYVRSVERRAGRPVAVIVAGCATAVAREAIASLEGVTAAVPGQDPEAVARALGVFPRGPAEMAPTLLQRHERGTRAWLKIQDGCDLRCSYCIIRVARGASRSRQPAAVVAEARRLAGHHPEISLTGIHIGLYGKDLHPRTSFDELLERLLNAIPAARFRIGSLECNQLNDRVIDLMAGSDGRLAPHLHVPLQSGSDAVLRRMRRAYPADRFRARVEKLCERVWPLGLGTDLIVGFPGETDRDHRRTLQLVEKLPFTYVHVFPYSDRDGTDATSFVDRVPARVKSERSRQLRELVGAKAAHYRLQRAGSRARVTLEGDELDVAVTGDYLKLSASDSLRARGPRLQPALIESDGEGELRATAPNATV